MLSITLSDCFMEIFAYTLYLLEDLNKGEEPEFQVVVKHYENLFDRSKNMAREAGFSNVKWKKGLFPVCAYIDEKILCSTWKERQRWMNNQLQRKFFNTTNAGKEFFERMERLSEEEKDLREVYSYCLSFGYRGRYYHVEDTEKLQELKTENLLSYFEDDEDVSVPDVLCPMAYPEGEEKPRLRSRWINKIWFVGLILPPLIVGALFWAAKFYLENFKGSFF